MSEQENVAPVEALYAAFARGDVQAILSRLTEDVEWTLDGPSAIPYAGKKIGPTAVMDFFQKLGSTQNAVKLTMGSYIAQGDKVASVGRYAGTVSATGKSIDCAVAHIFTIRDGKVSQFQDFVDTAQMADARLPRPLPRVTSGCLCTLRATPFGSLPACLPSSRADRP